MIKYFFLFLLSISKLDCYEIKFCDIKNNQEIIKDKDNPLFILVYSGLVCHECCTKIEDYINKNFNDSKFFCLIYSTENIITRKEKQTFINKFIKPDKFIFCLNFNTQDSILFNELNKFYSPSLIYIKSQTIKFIPYSILFQTKGVLSDIKELIK